MSAFICEVSVVRCQLEKKLIDRLAYSGVEISFANVTGLHFGKLQLAACVRHPVREQFTSVYTLQP